MSMMQNAVVSIQIGMEDFHEDDPRRVLSAIRNLYAGILLLFKCKLQELSPDNSKEALLKARVIPVIDPVTGKATWVGKGDNTVDVQDIQERLKSLGVDGVEWSRLNALQKIRKDIEHYYSQEPVERMKEAVANALHLIMQFCEPHLDEQPVNILGRECWDLMLSVATVYDAELKACRDNLDSVSWPFEEVKASVPSMRCPICDSQLMKVIDTTAKRDRIKFICSSCQEKSDYGFVVGPAVSDSLASVNHWSYKDGGDPVTCACPECDADSFLIEHNECAACFYELEYTECKWCQDRLTLDDLHLEGVCGSCQHRYDKMMAE